MGSRNIVTAVSRRSKEPMQSVLRISSRQKVESVGKLNRNHIKIYTSAEVFLYSQLGSPGFVETSCMFQVGAVLIQLRHTVDFLAPR